MCGIIGYVGHRPVAPILLQGLAALEYRGYDSTGIAVVNSADKLIVKKSPGKLLSLITALGANAPVGRIGIGHTRWATHGVPSEENSHPHTDCNAQIAVVHNGIVENYRPLKLALEKSGHRFASETDSEVIAHLVEDGLSNGQNLVDSVRQTACQLEGAQAAVVLGCKSNDTAILAFRIGNAGGLTIGHGNGETFVASDLTPLLSSAHHVTFLEDGEMAVIKEDTTFYLRVDGTPLKKSSQALPYNSAAVAKGSYPHFMLKEIFEQPQAIIDAIRGRISFDLKRIILEEVPFTQRELRSLRNVVLVGMGTSWHTAQLGRLMFEGIAGIPSIAENAAEFRYQDPLIGPSTLVISIGQSGETADTLAAMEEARRKGARLLTICNVPGSQASRLAEGTLFMRAGPEVGVAATKTFTCSAVTLFMLAIFLGNERGFLPEPRAKELIHGLTKLSGLIGEALKADSECAMLAKLFHQNSSFLCLGRGLYYPIALEAALKLKEVSYIHAEACPAGEMKHGPIALVDSRLPVIALALEDGLRSKMEGNIAEIKARGGTVVALGTTGDEGLQSQADQVIYVPSAPPFLGPLLATIPLQMLAYYIAVERNCDVDQPRNLAKSVTVE